MDIWIVSSHHNSIVTALRLKRAPPACTFTPFLTQTSCLAIMQQQGMMKHSSRIHTVRRIESCRLDTYHLPSSLRHSIHRSQCRIDSGRNLSGVSKETNVASASATVISSDVTLTSTISDKLATTWYSSTRGTPVSVKIADQTPTFSDRPVETTTTPGFTTSNPSLDSRHISLSSSSARATGTSPSEGPLTDTTRPPLTAAEYHPNTATSTAKRDGISMPTSVKGKWTGSTALYRVSTGPTVAQIIPITLKEFPKPRDFVTVTHALLRHTTETDTTRALKLDRETTAPGHLSKTSHRTTVSPPLDFTKQQRTDPPRTQREQETTSDPQFKIRTASQSPRLTSTTPGINVTTEIVPWNQHFEAVHSIYFILLAVEKHRLLIEEQRLRVERERLNIERERLVNRRFQMKHQPRDKNENKLQEIETQTGTLGNDAVGLSDADVLSGVNIKVETSQSPTTAKEPRQSLSLDRALPKLSSLHSPPKTRHGNLMYQIYKTLMETEKMRLQSDYERLRTQEDALRSARGRQDLSGTDGTTKTLPETGLKKLK